MGMIEKLPDILSQARATYERLREEPHQTAFLTEEIFHSPENRLVKGDNLLYMRELLRKGMEGKLDFIYIDPPFFSKADYTIDIRVEKSKKKLSLSRHRAFSDRWDRGFGEYLEMMSVRLFFMKALLSETGSIFVHLDWHSAHYMKVIMDEIFGEDMFVNEIIWQYKSGGASSRHFGRKHDTILFYAKSRHYFFQAQKEKSYNRQLKPYRFKGVKEYKDEQGWYTLVSMKDVWQIDMVGRTAGERTGYATQKPEALVQRLLQSATKEGDLCGDFFCGSGTLGAVAWKMGRRFLMCDNGQAAIVKSHKRLVKENIPHVLLYEKRREERETLMLEAQCSLKKDHLLPSLKIRLKGISYPRAEELGLDEESQGLLLSLLKKDFTQLIEYWCVDTDYDGRVLKPKASFCADKKAVAKEAVIPQNPGKTVAVKVMDVFGNEGMRTFDF